MASDFKMQQAMMELYNSYGVTTYPKGKALNKFGKSNNVDAGSWQALVQLPGTVRSEDLQTDNTITHFSSTNAGDTQQIKVEGHTISGGDLTFITQTVTLDGQTKTALTTPMARANRIINLGTTDFAGTVTVYEDTTITGGIPTDDTTVHAIVIGDENQTLKCSTAISSTDYWILTSLYASALRGSNARIDVELRVAPIGGIFSTKYTIGLGTSATNTILVPLDPYIIVPANSDAHMRAEATANNAQVSGSMNGYLLAVV